MNKLLCSLQEVCRNYPLQEKVLLVPGYGAGHEFCEALARESGGWLNLRPETTTGLAHQSIGETLADQSITLLSSSLAAAVVEEIFQDLEGRNALQYFLRKGNSQGLVRAVASSIFELRNAGITSDNLPEDSFVDAKKGQDLFVLLKAYEGYLEQHRTIDSPGLLSLALSLLPSGASPANEVVYLLPEFLSLSPLEAKWIKALAGERLRILYPDPVYRVDRPGLVQPRPENCGSPASSSSDVERLSWLYQVEQSPPPVGDGSLDYFQAYGKMNEVREIFRRLQAEGLPFDTVTVAYTSGEYIPVFYTLARRLGLGLTVAEGIPGSLTAPGRLLQGLVEWIGKDFSTGTLRELLLGGDVQFRSEAGKTAAALSPFTAARLLQKSGIGWGRDRYVLLQAMAESLRERAGIIEKDGEEEGRREYFLQQAEQAGRLYEVLQTILNALPVPDEAGRVSFRELTSSLSQLLSELAHVKNELDAAALKGLVADLVQAGRFASFSLGMDEALERLGNFLSDFRIGASGPKPGHLYLVHYGSLIWSNRPNTFVVGLDANTFPGGGRQDPVLLDEERERIHTGLPLGTDRPGENQYALALALASRRGRVTLSFPSFDVVENRSVYPSSVLLQIYRLLRKDVTLDYSKLIQSLGRTAGYCPQDGQPGLDEVEWWVGRVLNKPGIKNGAAVVRTCYDSIDRGRRALEARAGAEPTEYDGIINVASGELDPRQNNGLVMSCSRIEYLAGCPFAYFLRYVLKVYPPEGITYDPGCWLAAMERGSLLHELFYTFMKRLSTDNETVNALVHRARLLELANEFIQDYRKRIPPPIEVVFNREVSDIHRCCEVFLVAEAAHAGGTPVLFEVPFGLGAEEVSKAGAGLADPVAIGTDQGTGFLLRGIIDRVDRARAEVYHVWDYKTGSTYGYDDHKYLCSGRQIQHALYAIAAEEILKEQFPGETPRVEISGYYFPTDRGEGRRVARPQSDRSSVSRALKQLFDILAGGSFVAADNEEKCGFCDYNCEKS